MTITKLMFLTVFLSLRTFAMDLFEELTTPASALLELSSQEHLLNIMTGLVAFMKKVTKKKAKESPCNLLLTTIIFQTNTVFTIVATQSTELAKECALPMVEKGDLKNHFTPLTHH